MAREEILQEAYNRGFEKVAQEADRDTEDNRKSRVRKALATVAAVTGAAGLGYGAYATRGVWRPYVRPYLAAATGKIDMDNRLGKLIRKVRRGEDAKLLMGGAHPTITTAGDLKAQARAAARRAPRHIRELVEQQHYQNSQRDLSREFPQASRAGSDYLGVRKPTLAEMLLPASLQQRDPIQIPPHSSDDAIADALVGGYGRNSNIVDAIIERLRNRDT